MLNQFLASLGVGAAKIDLILDQYSITMGDQVTGKLLLKGGETSQEIEALSVHFCLASVYAEHDRTIPVDEVIATVEITSEPFMVKAHQILEYPFSFCCPERIPFSSLNTRYYFETNLEIRRGIDADDRDFVEVYPKGLVQHFVAGFDELGLKLHSEGYTGVAHSAVQLMQFYPTIWAKGQFDELKFHYQPNRVTDRINGWFEVDVKTSGLLGALVDKLDLDEKKGSFSFSADQLRDRVTASETIRTFILEQSQHLL